VLSPRSAIAVAFLVCLAALAARTFLGAAPVGATKPVICTGLVDCVAVGGYDPVSYFTEGKAVVGQATIGPDYQDAIWRFVSSANRDTFKTSPAQYAPHTA
jgi:hypothetical protein